MSNTELLALGARVAQLRIARQLKQTELAYEAGVAHRTLQRLEAGEAVRSDGLLKVIKCLERLDGVLAALEVSGFSPYERLAEEGLTVSGLQKQRRAPLSAQPPQAGTYNPGVRKRRVRRSRPQAAGPGNAAGRAVESVTVQWPEDQH